MYGDMCLIHGKLNATRRHSNCLLKRAAAFGVCRGNAGFSKMHDLLVYGFHAGRD